MWARGFGRCYGITEDSPGITRDEAVDELTVGLCAYGTNSCTWAKGGDTIVYRDHGSDAHGIASKRY